MKCLFINLNRGAGVELIGNMFLDIISKFDIISEIDVWKIQCVNTSYETEFDKDYDIVFVNDPSTECVTTQNLISKLNPSAKIIAISHGTFFNVPVYYDAIIELNFEYVSQYYNTSDLFRSFPLNFTPGNIWKYYENADRSHILFTGRICKEKLPENAIDILYKADMLLDVYGPITDKEYFEKIKNKINYFDEVSHKELINIYNSYKYFFLASTTECLSMSIRESLACGCIPLVIDDTGYTNSISNYIIRYRNLKEFAYLLENEDILDFRTKQNIKDFNMEFSFDKMILDLLIYLRGFLGKTIKFINTPTDKINQLNDIKINEAQNYSYDIIDWNKLKI